MYRGRKPGWFYALVRKIWQAVFSCTIRVEMHGLGNLPAEGGVIIAVVHSSHLDPLVVSTLLRRKIAWMSRIEFYQSVVSRKFLQGIGAFAVNRQNPGLAPIRESARRLAAGDVVGIFPEGEIRNGGVSVCRGGGIKAGTMYLSALTGCPVVPVLVLGSASLSGVGPWLPALRGRIWLRVGQPVRADRGERDRAGRAAASAGLAECFRTMFREGQAEWNPPEDAFP